jgi:hypothetical protein
MVTPAAPEQVKQSSLQRSVPPVGGGMQGALAGTPVQMLLMLQRTAGNQAVNQLLRQYRSSRQPSPGLMPTVQRCGGKACNCSPEKKAAHTAVQPVEEEQVQDTSAMTLPSLQRDPDDDEDTGGEAQRAEQEAAGGGADEASTQSAADQSTEEPAQSEEQSASATNDREDASGTEADGGNQDEEQPAQDSNQGASTGEDTNQAADPGNTGDSGDADQAAAEVEPVAPVSGEGEQHEEEVFGGTVSLQGRTNASFGNSFTTTTIHTTPGDASVCGCEAKDCVHISGTLTSTFTMTTRVSLPTPPSGLTARQTQVAQYLIDNCISPHEQQHVAAFNAYRGTVATPFDLSCCRADVNSSLQAIHDGVEQPRHSSAQTTSDNLDPFNSTFDPDCADDADISSCITCPTP